MARLAVYNFEHGSFGELVSYGGSPACSIVTELYGSCIKSDKYGRYYAPASALTEFYLSALVKKQTDSTYSTGYYIFAFMHGSTEVASLKWQRYGYFHAKKGSTVLATSSKRMSSGDRSYLIEVHFVQHSSTGVFQVKLNGITIIDYSGNTGSSDIDRIEFGGSNDTTYNYYDNIVIDSASWPGDTKQTFLFPNDAGNSAQWTALAGGNYTNVDEAVVSDADYVYTNTNDKIDSYAMDDLPVEANSIVAVYPEVRAYKASAATPDSVGVGVRASGTDYPGSQATLGDDTETVIKRVLATNPATSAAWTPSEVNAVEVLIKSGA